jgi:outer membrane autotransporter protein
MYCNFAAEEKSEIQIRTDEAFAALAYADRARSNGLSPPQPERLWNAWANIGGGGLRVSDTSGSGNDARGNQSNITAGFERKITPNTLVGALVGYEHLNYSVAAQGASSKSDGDSVGGYVAHMFGNVRFDAAVGWTYLNYSSAVGGNNGSFVGNRWRVSTGLTGIYQLNGFVLQPSASAFVSWERDAAWTDNVGNAMGANRTTAGRTSLGTLAARPFVTSGGWIIAPYAGLYADWVFSSTSNSTLPVGPPIALVGDGWSGRVTAGLSAWPLPNLMLTLGGDYGGLGANYKIWTGNLGAAILF